MATDNHEFRQPPYGQEQWHNDWYENFETLDDRVEIRGPETSREDYVPHENALFRATDTDNLFLGDGEQWIQIQSSGDNPSFGTVGADRVRVSEPPEQETDVVRNIDLDDLDTGGDGFNHMLSETLDAQGNRIEDVGSLQTKSVSVTGAIDSEIYSDSFNTDTSSEWTTISGTLTWDTENGRLEMASSTRATTNQPDAGSGVYTTAITSMESDAGNIGIIWAVQDEGTYYHARIHPGNNEVQLFNFDGGSPTLLGSSSVEITPGTPYTLSTVWDEESGTIEIYLDSDPQLSSSIITAQDTTHGTGGFGIRSYDGGGYIESISYNPEIPSEATTTILTPESVSTGNLQTDGTHIAEQLDIPIYSDYSNAPNSTLYFNDAEGALKYKDASGVVHAPTGSGSGGGDFDHTLSATLDARGHAIDNVGSLNGGGPVSDGDGTERQIWVIDAGEGDPAGASDDDIIFERES